MHEEQYVHVTDAEHQSPQVNDLRQIAGTPVFTADNRRIGAIERVMSLSDSTGERYLVVNPGAWRRQLGADRLYIPEVQIHSAEEDRLVLETAFAALPTQEWAELPTGFGQN